MAKKGMARPDRTHTKPRNDGSPVPELQGKSKHTKEKAAPIIAGTRGAEQKVYHTETPLSNADRAVDSDPARDHTKNDIPAADLQDI